MDKEDDCILLVSNIPQNYHSYDLRRFFSEYVENSKFVCFHYRHRVEKRKPEENDDASTSNVETQNDTEKDKESGKAPSSSNSSFSREVTARVHKTGDNEENRNKDATCCCLIKIEQQYLKSFISHFHRKHWLDSEDCEMMSRCLIAVINEQRDLTKLPELRPPLIMPRGNVGTSTKYFLQAIRECRLPASMIGKLKLEFPKGRHKKYGAVPMEYQHKEGETLKTLTMLNRTKLDKLNKEGPRVYHVKDDNEDNDTCEEWERHEALHNDVHANRTIGKQVNSSSYLASGGDLEQQPGTKEKALEDEIELVWEKGGSGLNFYTDINFWRTQESQDFDELTTDDWDVDMSVYYDKETSHDKDAADRFNMRQSEFFRSGKHEESVFTKKKGGKRSSRGFSGPPSKINTVGAFEMHNRGVAGRIMTKSGWKEGHGLGPQGEGMKDALDGGEQGQGPADKRGLGYHGEKILFAPKVVKKVETSYVAGAAGPSGWRPPPPPGSRISSIYTKPLDLDPPERVDRTNPPLYLKFRNQSVKFHSGGMQGGSESKK